jgi:transcriptional regulator with XRE-family HTH domain
MAKKGVTEVDAHIGKRIRMRRMQLGLSQEKVADSLGLTFQQLQKYEKGTNGARGSRLVQLATVLQVSPAFFFEGLGAAGEVAKGGDLETQFFTKPYATDLALAFIRLASTKDRQTIAELAERLASLAGGQAKAEAA